MCDLTFILQVFIQFYNAGFSQAVNGTSHCFIQEAGKEFSQAQQVRQVAL